MADGYGMIKPGLELLPQIKDRMTFVYLEHCRISRHDSAIKVIDDTGIVWYMVRRMNSIWNFAFIIHRGNQ